MIKLIKKGQNHDSSSLSFAHHKAAYGEGNAKVKVRYNLDRYSTVVMFNPLMRVPQTLNVLPPSNYIYYKALDVRWWWWWWWQFVPRVFGSLTHPWRNIDSDNDNDAPTHCERINECSPAHVLITPTEWWRNKEGKHTRAKVPVFVKDIFWGHILEYHCNLSVGQVIYGKSRQCFVYIWSKSTWNRSENCQSLDSAYKRSADTFNSNQTNCALTHMGTDIVLCTSLVLWWINNRSTWHECMNA